MFAERHDTGYGFEVARLSFEIVDEAGAALDFAIGLELPGVECRRPVAPPQWTRYLRCTPGIPGRAVPL